MNQQYVLISVINDTKAYKKVKSKLKEIGYNRFTTIDTMGATVLLDNMEFMNMFSNTLSENEEYDYNKTLMLVLPNEEEVEYVMDEIEDILMMDRTKPGKGIMFTIPILVSQGVRFNKTK